MSLLLRAGAAPAALLAAALALTACGSSVASSSGSGDDAVSIENCGRTVAFDGPPTRVVGLSPAQTELLVEMGVADTLVGQGQVDTHPLDADVEAQVRDVPVLGAAAPPSREALLEVRPDFVFAPTEYEFTAAQGFASIDQLATAGVASYVATGGCGDRRTTAEVDDLFTDIENLGVIFDRRERASELVDEGRARLDRVAADAGASRPTVAQVYVEGPSLSVIGAGVEADIVERAGGDNVFRPDEPMFSQFFVAVVNPEELSARNPEAIVFGVTSEAHLASTRAYLEATFPDVAAVRNGRLIPVPASEMLPGTIGNIDAVETISRGLTG